MSDLIEPLPWDTDFFGVPIARADLADVDADRLRLIEDAARDAGIACLYGTLEPTDETAAYLIQSFGHRLVEVSLTFDRPPGPFTPKHETSRVRRGTLDDIPQLEPAIRMLAPWSRFAADPRFGADAALRMHRAWIERAARDTDERALYVAYDDTGITGVATFARTPVPRVDIQAVTRPGSDQARRTSPVASQARRRAAARSRRAPAPAASSTVTASAMSTSSASPDTSIVITWSDISTPPTSS